MEGREEECVREAKKNKMEQGKKKIGLLLFFLFFFFGGERKEGVGDKESGQSGDRK